MSIRIAVAAGAVLAAAACATVQPIPRHGGSSGYVCNNSGLDRFVGQPATSEVGAEMLRASGARIIRWVRPGQAITMEFSAERLTVHLDANGRVERASCG
jgi:hypothetical protein